MLGQIDRLDETDFEDRQTRIAIDPGRAPVDHAGTGIAMLFRYWQERRLIDDGVPLAAEFRSLLEQYPWVDVSRSNPLNFIMHNHPAGVCGDWEGRRFADHPVRIHAKACAREYQNCKDRAAPVYVYTKQEMLGIDREYAKILLPLADEAGCVTRVVYAWRFLSVPRKLPPAVFPTLGGGVPRQIPDRGYTVSSPRATST